MCNATETNGLFDGALRDALIARQGQRQNEKQQIHKALQKTVPSSSFFIHMAKMIKNRKQKKKVNSVLKGDKAYGIKKMQSRVGRIRQRERGRLHLSPFLW